jgi:hypothetical protein
MKGAAAGTARLEWNQAHSKSSLARCAREGTEEPPPPTVLLLIPKPWLRLWPIFFSHPPYSSRGTDSAIFFTPKLFGGNLERP